MNIATANARRNLSMQMHTGSRIRKEQDISDSSEDVEHHKQEL